MNGAQGKTQYFVKSCCRNRLLPEEQVYVIIIYMDWWLKMIKIG